MVFGHTSKTTHQPSVAPANDDIIQKLNQLSVVVNKILEKVNDIDKRVSIIEFVGFL